MKVIISVFYGHMTGHLPGKSMKYEETKPYSPAIVS